MKWLVVCCLLLIVTACDDGLPDKPDADPVPVAHDGLKALFSGDVTGVNRYFCDEILLDAREIAQEAGSGESRIEFMNAELREIEEAFYGYTTVVLEGEYAIWRFGQPDIRDTDEIGITYIWLKAVNDRWEICYFGAEEPPNPLDS